MTEDTLTPSEQEHPVSQDAAIGQEPATGEDAGAETAPVLNREQRRALARGKKPAPTAKPGQAQGGPERAAGRGAAPAGGSLFPRTGHK